MGNLTQLHQGSLNGLRRQTNECLDNAYNKGYQDGKKDFEVSNGQAEYNNGYKQGIADYRKFENFFHSDGATMFDDIRNTDGTLSLEMILLYLPMSEIMARIKVYEEKKKAEEEIIKGDTVCFKSNPNITFIVWDIVDDVDEGDEGIFLYGFNQNGTYSNVNIKNAKKVNVPNCYSEVSQLLDKLRGEEGEEE